MMKESIINLEKKKIGEVDLSDEVFDVPINKCLVYDALKMQMASRRHGDAFCKNRSLVSGSTRKIYRQKGTGRARHNSRKANIFVGGGKAFGPRPRDYSYAIPVKARRGALCSALASKRIEGKLLIVDQFDAQEPKTSPVSKALASLGVKNGLIVTEILSNNLKCSVRNIPHIKLICADNLNLYDVLSHEHLVITSKALTKVQENLKS